MGHHGFGRGEYKYFAYPLPAIVTELRTSLYVRLAPIANQWSVAMGREAFPDGASSLFPRVNIIDTPSAP
jgi:hypothetical protein